MTPRITAKALTFLACCAATPASADSVSQQLLPILGLQGVEAGDHLASPWEPARAGGLAVGFRDEDLLRGYVGGVKVADLGSRQRRVTARIPLAGRPRQWLQLLSSTDAGDHAGSSRDLDWTGALSTSSSRYQLSWDLEGKTHRFAAAISWARERGRDQADLHRFHRSASDSRMNRFFWDLLEPTIGDQVRYTLNSRSRRLGAGWVIQSTDRSRAGVQIQWRRVEPDIELGYVNTGSDPRLQGTREASVEQRLTEGRLAAGVEGRLAPSTWLRAEVGYAARQLDSQALQRDVPRSDSGLLLDIVELGRADAEQRGPDVTLRATWTRRERLRAEGYVGLGRSQIDADGQGSTPVLGFSLLALPISHGGAATLTGRLTSRAAGFNVHRRWSRSGVYLRGMAVRSEYRGRTQADAQMEFGLFVTPVDRVSAYRLHLYRLSAAPWLRIGEAVEVEYQITQYMGSFRDLRRAQQVEDTPSEFRGGRVHAATVRYRL